MTGRIASLPMYDADRAAVAAWWQGLSRALRAQGLGGVPTALDSPDDLDAHWRDPRLLLSQTCGYPLVTTLRHAVQVVGAMRYNAPGCVGITYRSELLARSDDAESIEGFRRRTAAINAVDSHSGCNALLAHVAPLAVEGRFFGKRVVTGSHRKSLEAVQAKRADIAAIDCVTLAGLARQAPELLHGLRSVGSTRSVPGLPLVTTASTTAEELHALRAALVAATDDPTLADVRKALFIDGFEIACAADWLVIDEQRRTTGAALRHASG